MQNFMFRINWKNKSLPTEIQMSAKTIDNLRANIISKGILKSEKIDDLTVFKLSGKTKKPVFVGYMSLDQYIYRWIIRDSEGYPIVRDIDRKSGKLRRK